MRKFYERYVFAKPESTGILSPSQKACVALASTRSTPAYRIVTNTTCLDTAHLLRILSRARELRSIINLLGSLK
jgi:hypothetical protein